jgi:uncharacterized protein
MRMSDEPGAPTSRGGDRNAAADRNGPRRGGRPQAGAGKPRTSAPPPANALAEAFARAKRG